MTGFQNRGALASVAAAMAVAAIALGVVACGDDDDDDGGAASSPTAGGSQAAATITISDNQFSPAGQTVQKGAKVTWNWTGNNPHSVVGKFAGADVKSEQQSSGKFEFTFAQAGTFDYQCGVHGAAMAGKVTVQ